MLATQTLQSASPRDALRHGPLLAIVVPTFNEHDNVRELVQRIDRCLAGVDWEIVFVDDDSADGTLKVLRDLSRADARVRHLQRIGRRGLASAVVEGILSTSAPYIAVMDADLQHDESKLAEMLRRLGEPDCDIVVGSRYTGTGGTGDWSKARRLISDVATRLARVVLRTTVSDPMSGFFMLKRDAFDAAVRRLSSTGYKILLDILVSAPRPLAVVEVPYVFRSRQHGESKLDSAVTLEFLMLLLDKTVGRFVPGRFVMFALVGGVGVFVHMLVLAALNQGLDAGIHGEPARRHRCRHDVQLLRQQCSDLSGQAPERSLAGHARAADVLCRVRHRRAFQRRHRHRAVPRGLFLVARGPRRNSGGRRLELCRKLDGHVAEVTPPLSCGRRPRR